MFRIANKRNYKALGIESGLQLAFASPALDFGFAGRSSLNDAIGDFAARLQSAAALFTRLLTTVLPARRVERGTVEGSAAGDGASASRGTVAPSRAVPQAIRPMTLADQWSRVTAVLSQSVDGARVASEMQSAATQQLDLAQYGLITLMDELSTVMAIPGRRSRSATVHAFNSAAENADPAPLLGQALAA